MPSVPLLYFLLALSVTCGGMAAVIMLWHRAKNRVKQLQQELHENSTAMDQILTEADRTHLEAAEALKKAETASALKSDFLANTSHEIRTPMNAILGMTRLLLDSPLTDEQQSWARIVRDSGENLLAIINDILDLSKIEAGGMILSPVPFNLPRAMAEVTDLLLMKAEQKNVVIAADIDRDVPRMIVGDIVRIRQIVLNLMSNAKKFTSAGHIKLSIARDPENSGNLLFSVEDTGIGIAADKLDYIFEKFTQAEGTTMRRYGGTGLGLAITKKLILLMGGTLKVTSTVNKGSCFSFSLPLQAAETAPTKLPSYSLQGRNMLICTDNHIGGKLVEKFAQNIGIATATFANGPDIQQHLHQLMKQNVTYDYLLVDHNMGGNELLELMDRVRIYPSCENIACIAVTVLGSMTTSRILNSDKIAALLSRPLFPDQLEDSLQLIEDMRLGKRKTALVTRTMIEKCQSSTQEKSEAKPSFNGAKILVVEDIEANQMLMAKVLEKLNCVPEAAMSGREAIEKFQEKRYDLIFMDGHMPEMDGFEATRIIRALEKNSDRHTVIVALTADAMSGDAEKYMGVGMNDYLNKPVTPERIASMLGKWVQH